MFHNSSRTKSFVLCIFLLKQVTRLALMNSKLTQSLSMHNLATSLDSDSDNSTCSTPQARSPSQSSLVRKSKKDMCSLENMFTFSIDGYIVNIYVFSGLHFIEGGKDSNWFDYFHQPLSALLISLIFSVNALFYEQWQCCLS